MKGTKEFFIFQIPIPWFFITALDEGNMNAS